MTSLHLSHRKCKKCTPVNFTLIWHKVILPACFQNSGAQSPEATEMQEWLQIEIDTYTSALTVPFLRDQDDSIYLITLSNTITYFILIHTCMTGAFHAAKTLTENLFVKCFVLQTLTSNMEVFHASNAFATTL